MKALFVTAIVAAAFSAQAKENMSPDAQAVDSACASDAATAGCGSEKVGTGMMKCIHAYHQSHKDWKPSDACNNAMKTMHADKKK